MKDCQECKLSVEDDQYFEHYLVDHNLIFCIFCNNKLKPRNYQRHIFAVHNIDWNDIEFVQQFIKYYGDSITLLSFIHELTFFIPLSIIKSIKELLLATPNRPKEDILYLQVELAQTQLRLGEILPNISSIISELYKKIFESSSLLLRTKFIFFALEVNIKGSFTELMIQEFKKLLENINAFTSLEIKLEILGRAISISFQEKDKVTAKNIFETAKTLISQNKFIGKEKNLLELKIINQLINENFNEYYKLIVDYIDKNQDYPVRIAQFKRSKAMVLLNNKNYIKAINDITSAMELFKEQEYNVDFIETSQQLSKIYILSKKYTDSYDNIRKTRDFFEKLIGPDNVGVLKYLLPVLNELLNNLRSDDHHLTGYKETHELRIKIMDIIEDIEDDLDYFFNDLQENKELLQNINELKIAFNDYYDLLKQLEKQVLIKELTKIGSNTISIFDEDFKLLDQNLRTELFSILANVEQLIGYKFNNTNLLWQALIDPEDEKLGKNTLCGKLAFLGDAALKLALSDLLIEIDISNATLDKLSKARSSFESNIFLAKIFDKISLKDYVLTNRLMIPNDEHWKGTVMEAIIGAIYLEGGINSVKRLIIGWKPDLLAKNII